MVKEAANKLASSLLSSNPEKFALVKYQPEQHAVILYNPSIFPSASRRNTSDSAAPQSPSKTGSPTV